MTCTLVLLHKPGVSRRHQGVHGRVCRAVVSYPPFGRGIGYCAPGSPADAMAAMQEKQRSRTKLPEEGTDVESENAVVVDR